MITNPYARLLHKVSEALRYNGTETNRQCTVEKVEEKGGERKALVVWGHKPDGTPCRVWVNSQEQRSSNDRSQDSLKPGQNGVLQGPLRQATFTSQAEATHAPQPKHAPQVNGHSRSIGKKLRTALHGGQDDQQQGGGAGGQGGGGGGGGGQQQGEKEHYAASWISEDEEQLPKWGGSALKSGGSSSGSQSSFQSPQKSQGQQGQQQQEKRAMQQVMHEKEGLTGVVGKGDEGVRYSAHPKGGKVRAGKDNYFVAEKDKDSYMGAKKNNRVFREDGKNFVDDPWIIKKKKPDPVPNHDLA